MTSILDTIKKMLGIESADTAFDTDIIVNINTAFMVLNQLGVGPSSIFSITDKDDTWESFFGTGEIVEAVKTYIYFKVKIAFDPPTISTVLEALKNQISEYEWRLNVNAEKGEVL